MRRLIVYGILAVCAASISTDQIIPLSTDQIIPISTDQIIPFTEPRVDYFDGIDTANKCMSRLERRIEGKSGILISHAHFDISPYKGGRNCFIMLAVPIGYRVRLRILTFDVNGKQGKCDKDTLHVFDHETAIDPGQPHRPSDESVIPGPILGQFCGSISNTSELLASHQNVMTLWWHTNPHLKEGHGGRGFKLIWNAFRKEMSAPCAVSLEFACGNAECIPSELGCNSYPDCTDRSDLEPRRQMENQCDQVNYDSVQSLSAVTMLLVTSMCVVILTCLCFCICFCCPCVDSRLNAEQKIEDSCSRKEYTPATEETASSRDVRSVLPPYHPQPPTFYPPQPPAGSRGEQSSLRDRPIKPLHHSKHSIHNKSEAPSISSNYYHKFQLPRGVRIRTEYGEMNNPPPSSVGSDYTYVRPVDSHIV